MKVINKGARAKAKYERGPSFVGGGGTDLEAATLVEKLDLSDSKMQLKKEKECLQETSPLGRTDVAATEKVEGEVSLEETLSNDITIQPGTEEEDVSEPKILQLRSGPTYRIPVKLGNIELMAVVDTAAQVTIISDNLLRRLKVAPPEIRKIVLQTAGRKMKMSGSIVGPVLLQLGNKTCEEEIYVAPIQDDMLLGLDLLRKHCAEIDLQAGTIRIDNEVVNMELSGSRAISKVVVARRTIVPPNSVGLVPCQTSTKVSQFMFKPRSDLQVLVPRSVHKGTSHMVICAVNTTDKNVVFKMDQRVGKAEEVAVIQQVLKENVSQEYSPRRMDTSIPNHLAEMLNNSKEYLNDVQLKQLAELTCRYQDVFAKDDFDLGNFTTIEHSIDTKDAPPVKQRMRRTPVCFVDEEKANLDKMLKAKVIEPSSSEWASAPVLIRKRDGQVRWCVDYRALNAVTRKDVYPLPLLDECMDTLAENTCFSKLDANSAYWQVPIKESDRKKSAFITKYGLFQFIRMAFGLCNAPATYSRIMNLVLRGLNWDIVLAFLDDIIVMGRDFEDHLWNLEEVLKRLQEYGLKLKPRKCELCKPRVKFLGRWVGEDGLQLDEENIKTVKEWPRPETTRHVEQFLGLMNYHRNFMKDYARIAVPLYGLTGKAKFVWRTEHEEAFQQIKEALTQAPVLGLPNKRDPFILDTDASDIAIGAVVSQVQKGEEKVIAYASVGLSPEQRRYCTTRKELLSIVKFTRQFRHYLLGRPFLVRTDHSSLTWLLNFKDPQGQLARWLEELSQYDMIVRHRAGKKHVNADCMSRRPHSEIECPNYLLGVELKDLPCKGCPYCTKAHENWQDFAEEVDDVVPLAQVARHKRATRQMVKILEEEKQMVEEISISQVEIHTHADRMEIIPELRAIEEVETEPEQINWEKEQSKDPDLNIIREFLKEGKVPTEAELFAESKSAKHMWINKECFELKDGILRRKDPKGGCPRVVPVSLKTEIMAAHHDLPSSGHQGAERTELKLRDKFWWKGIGADIRNYVATCGTCNRNKKPSRHAKAPLKSYQAGAPMERVHLDFLGPLPKTPNGNEYVLMMVDQFTKWVECIPLPSQTAEVTAHAAVMEFFSRFGYPLQIHTDQGRNFESQLFKAVCELLKIHKSRTTPYRPSANGQVERFNRTLMNAVRCFVSSQTSWDRFIPQLAGAMRSCVNRQTGFTPNMLMLGRETNQPADLIFPDDKQKEQTVGVDEYVGTLSSNITRAHKVAREKLKTAQKTMKRDYDVKVLVKSYEVGDPVYILDTATTKGTSSKLKAPWKGPAIIVEKITAALFRVLVKEKEFVVNHDRIKLCKDRELPFWIKRLQRDPELLEAAASRDSLNRREILHCLCRKPDTGGFMIQCDYCLEWFHGPCVNLSPAQAKKISKYVCQNCREDPAIGPLC